MKIWAFVLGLVALLLLMSVWPAIGPNILKSPGGVLVPLGLCLLLADRAFFTYRGRA